MALDELIYKRICESTELTKFLARYNDQPAVFFQKAPDDTAAGWKKRCQYPRIDYAVDLQSNPERKTSGTLTLTIWSLGNSDTLPEDLEPIVKKLLCGVFLKPNDAPPYSLSWARSDAFNEEHGDNIVIGIVLTFDVYGFPNQITSDPDPVLAINAYIKKLEPNATIIGSDDFEETLVPNAQNPAFYFRLESIQTQRETNTVAWMDAVLAGHIFAEDDATKWLKILVDALALDGEVTMLDTSPMFITSLKADNTLDALSVGQLRIFVRFGILRRKPFAHELKANVDYTTI